MVGRPGGRQEGQQRGGDASGDQQPAGIRNPAAPQREQPGAETQRAQRDGHGFHGDHQVAAGIEAQRVRRLPGGAGQPWHHGGGPQNSDGDRDHDAEHHAHGRDTRRPDMTRPHVPIHRMIPAHPKDRPRHPDPPHHLQPELPTRQNDPPSSVPAVCGPFV
ncbi:hypothetical protein GCM10022226_02730 [Sphaerisporangium flaviroseum]|uniref:Uncharacterized protein n=1 Tax=Sphaerisporangium flaviroseum TaxID=509199 RepID=A0ABP7H888_9ACTN